MMTSTIHPSQNFFAWNTSLLAQVDYSYSTEGNPPGPIFWVCWAAFVILMLAALWKVFSKAGHPRMARHHSDHEHTLFDQVAGRPGWWELGGKIPCNPR